MLTIPDNNTAKNIIITSFNAHAPDYFSDTGIRDPHEVVRYDANKMVQNAGHKALQFCADIILKHFEGVRLSNRDLAAHITGVSEGFIDIPDASPEACGMLTEAFGEIMRDIESERKQVVAACTMLGLTMPARTLEH